MQNEIYLLHFQRKRIYELIISLVFANRNYWFAMIVLVLTDLTLILANISHIQLIKARPLKVIFLILPHTQKISLHIYLSTFLSMTFPLLQASVAWLSCCNSLLTASTCNITKTLKTFSLSKLIQTSVSLVLKSGSFLHKTLNSEFELILNK